jgi:hypothetical protein
MSGTASGIARYGLTSNPYTPRPLDPLTKEEQLATVAGALDDAESYVEEIAREGVPGFVLVSGRSGAGRTTIANHLLTCYRRARGITDPKRFIVPQREFSGQDPHDIFNRWVASLYTKLKGAGLAQLLGEEDFDFRHELSTRESMQRDTYSTFLADFLPALSAVLAQHGAAFGACFENLKDYNLARAAFESFADAPTLVLLTVLEYPREEDTIHVLFERHVPHGASAGFARYPIVDVALVTGSEAKILVQHHWARVTELDSPFDDAGLEQGFGDKPRTAGRVLQLTGHALENRAAIAGEGPLWPDARDELALHAELLSRLLAVADKLVPEPTVRI